MQVKLITTVETVIEVDREFKGSFEDTQQEIFNNFLATTEDTDTDDIKDAQHCAAVLDTVINQTVTHSFEEVK